MELSWNQEVGKHGPDAVKLLVGNKVDLDKERKVSFEEGQALANKIGAVRFMETSAKTNLNVEEMFRELTMSICVKGGYMT